MIKMFIVGGGCEDAFTQMGFNVVDDPLEADMFQFMGGEDVSPELYGEKNTHSYNNLSRDIKEMGYFQLARMLGRPCAGICRGGQFLNVMCGGKMKQDIGGHTRNHEMVISYNGVLNQVLEVTSTHHQMMLPSNEGRVLGTAVHDGGIEVVAYNFYGGIRCLCFQPHPEYHIVDMPELAKLYVDLVEWMVKAW